VQHHKDGSQNTSEASTPWRLLFSFTESESFPIDSENFSHVICTKPDPQGLFWSNVICVKAALLHEADGFEAELLSQLNLDSDRQPTKEEKEKFMCKYVMLGNEVKLRIGGSVVTIRKLTTELERIRALREVFGIDLPDEAQAHILGRDAALH
jgi:hypothetical protein